MAVNGWIIERTVDLAHPPKTLRNEQPYEIAYTGDVANPVWTVHVLQDGQPVALGGSVKAYIKRIDGAEVVSNGTIIGNTVSVQLGGSNFGQPGYAWGILRYTDSTTNATVTLDALTMIVQSDPEGTSVLDPDDMLPTLQELLAELDDMRDATAAAEAAAECIADDYSTSATYAVGDYVLHNGGLYRCTTPITSAETWTAAHWTQVVFGDEVRDVKSAFVTEDGLNKVKAQNLQIIDAVMSPNLIDTTKITNGKYIQKNGVEQTGSYQVTDYIPVEAGEKYCFTWKYNNNRTGAYLRFFACYDSSKTVMASAGSDTAISTYPITIAGGVAFVRLSFSNNTSNYSDYQFEKGETPTDYHPYGIISAVVKDDYLPVTTDDIEALETSLAGKVNLSGTAQVTPKNLQIMDLTYAPNLLDESTITTGGYIQKNGTISESNSYQYTDYIPVEAGEKYYFTWLLNNAYRTDGVIRFLACYNSSKEIISSAGNDSSISSFPMTIAEGVSYIRASFSTGINYTEYQFEKGEAPTAYYPYGTIIGAVVNGQYLPDDPISMDDIPAFHLVDGQNLLNQDDPDFEIGFLYTGGTVDATLTSYRTSGYIAVSPGERLMGSYAVAGGSGYVAFRTVAAYNASKTVIGASGAYSVDSSVGYFVPAGVSYVRICYQYSTYGDNVQICKTDSNKIKPYKPYEAPHYELKDEYLAPLPSAPEHVYLPDEIYVAIGRTIELYNEQIVLDYAKYHFRWICSKGKADKRKFSINGTTSGDVSLNLELYDDKMNLCWIGGCTIHVVAASNPEKKILPIGDSLTRGKAWLPEIMLLGSENITWLGTRYSSNLKDSENNTYSTIHHEGRSGWGANDYLADTEYDQDTAYDGVPGVDGSANPFWDGTKFSLEHYLTTQTGIDTPDAVQIFLGTNDLTVNAQTAINNIVEMVTTIRDEYEDLPIFVCNTIFRSNQNGYGSTGDDAYAGAGAGANAFQYEQDIRVMDLMEGLRTELRTMTGVYLIPLATCMDREYDFGQVMTKVNPRSNVEIAMPAESVHPQAPGYYQMADLMYSFYCGILAE